MSHPVVLGHLAKYCSKWGRQCSNSSNAEGGHIVPYILFVGKEQNIRELASEKGVCCGIYWSAAW